MKPFHKALPGAVALTFFVALPAYAGPAETRAAEQALADAGLDEAVDVSVNDEGVAVLSGTVDSPSDGNMALKAVRDVPGVTRVQDMTRWDD